MEFKPKLGKILKFMEITINKTNPSLESLLDEKKKSKKFDNFNEETNIGKINFLKSIILDNQKIIKTYFVKTDDKLTKISNYFAKKLGDEIFI